MEELVERIARWGIHPGDLVTHRFTIDSAAKAYKLMAEGRCGKVQSAGRIFGIRME